LIGGGGDLLIGNGTFVDGVVFFGFGGADFDDAEYVEDGFFGEGNGGSGGVGIDFGGGLEEACGFF